MEELWKDIPGYENLYQASNTGQIRTHPNKVSSSARSKVRHWKTRILKGRGENMVTGYRVSLWKEGKRKEFLVCRLVAMTWVQGYLPHLTVNHKDGNRHNNQIDNLEWVTLGENIRHGYATGLYSHQKAVTLVDVSGNEKSFRSMEEAGRFLGKAHGYLNCALKKKRRIMDQNGNEYKIKIE